MAYSQGCAYSTNTVSIGGARVGRIARGVPTVLIQFL